MRFLITGGSGFIGRRLAALLVERGHEVKALVRGTSVRTDLERAGATFAEGDLVTGVGIEAAVAEVDCVLHLAGLTKARTAAELEACNGGGTRALVEAAAARPGPPRFVYCSSLAAAGPTTCQRQRREEDAPSPISAYGHSKLRGELELRRHAHRVPSVIVRPPLVYGPADHEFLPSLLPMARLGLFLKAGFGPKRYSVVHVDDLCEALLGAALRGRTLSGSDPAAGVYFVSDGRDYEWAEFCQHLSEALGKRRPTVLALPKGVSYAVGLAGELGARLLGGIPAMNVDKARELQAEAWTCSNERARAELGFQPVYGLGEGLRQTLAWYREAGLLKS